MKQILTKSLDKIKSSLRWAWGHKLRVAVLGLVLALVAPRPAKSQFLEQQGDPPALPGRQ